MKTHLFVCLAFVTLLVSCNKTAYKSSSKSRIVKNETPNRQALERLKKEVSTVKRNRNLNTLVLDALPKREFRAAWVASVANIDWPSRKGLSSAEQRAEFVRIVEHHKRLGINALIVQIRAASDSFYGKSPEPWSEWLMGEQGVPPAPMYDPLEFMIKECHSRAMEFHAWFNLNRGVHKNAQSVMEGHITQTHPHWFINYDGYKLYNFGLPEVRDYIERVTLNVVRQYDIDGIHFDDYFYPYKVNGEYLNDESAFLAYPRGFSSIEDWRRDNINMIIKSLSEAIYEAKKWVKFGVSPFCAWRNRRDDPEGSNTRAGQPSYDFLYADTRMWLREGWVDYMAPQIYFPFEFDLVPYGTMTDWWGQNTVRTHLYIGQGVYRVGEVRGRKGWNDPSQISRQIQHNRNSPKVKGSIFYNTNTLMRNKLGVRDSIASLYRLPALSPRMTWKDAIPPATPSDLKLNREYGRLVLSWQVGKTPALDGDRDWMYVVYHFKENQEHDLNKASSIVRILPASAGRSLVIPKEISRYAGGSFVVTSLDRMKNESDSSKPLAWKQNQLKVK